MKKILLGALLVIGSAIYAQDVPGSVMKSFKSKFPQAQEAEWNASDAGYDVDFYDGPSAKFASFDANGNWISTRTMLDSAPAAITKAVSTNFKKASVDAVALVESNDGSAIYEISASNDTNSYTITADQSGKILSSEEFSNDGGEYNEE
ncbi:MAG: PepSY-like domain-containing protein [Flavobacteriales bacterium]|nr:PepSY-like domain-containing protein [Flavobacteriales bacterium]